jgi:hypothetical protein
MSLRAKLSLALCSVLLHISPLLLCQTTNNAATLSCWEGKNRANFQSRQAKTPVSKSSGGFAYGETFAEASSVSQSGQFCKNRVQLFYSRGGSDYKVVYEKTGLEDQGVGIRVVGWSNSGKLLLIELSIWGYDTEADTTKSALLLDSSTAQVKELPLPDAFERVLGKDCEFDSSLLGWGRNERVLVRVSKTPSTSRYEQTFCVEKPTVYAYSLQTGELSRSKQ